MVNLRSRKIEGKPPDVKNMEAAAPRGRRASSVHAESPKPRSRRLSEKSEDSEAPGTPRSQRKSLRLNSPAVLSKNIKSNLFAGGSEGAKTRPAPIFEEKSETPPKETDETSVKSGKGDALAKISPVVLLEDIRREIFPSDSTESKGPTSPIEEVKGASVKGRRRKISDYFDSGTEDAKTPGDNTPVRLNDLYRASLASVAKEDSMRPSSPVKEKRGPVKRITNRKISDFFDSGKDGAKLDSEKCSVLSTDVKSSTASGDSREGEETSVLVDKDKSESPVKVKKISDKLDSSNEDARSKGESSPSRSTFQSGSHLDMKSPRGNSNSRSARTGNTEDKTGRKSPRLMEKSSSPVRKSAKRPSKKSVPSEEAALDDREDIEPTEVTSTDNQKRKSEGKSPTCFKERSLSPVKRSANRLLRKSDSGGGTDPGKEDVVQRSEVTSFSSDDQKGKTDDKSPGFKERSLSPDKRPAKRLSRKSISSGEDVPHGREDGAERIEVASFSSANQREKTEEKSPTRFKRRSLSPAKKSAKGLLKKSDPEEGRVPDDVELVAQRTETASQSPRKLTKSEAESVEIPTNLQSPKRKDMSVSPVKGRVGDFPSSPVSKDDTPAEKAEISLQSPRKRKESGSDRLSAAEEGSKSDAVSIRSTDLRTSPRKNIDGSSAKEKNVPKLETPTTKTQVSLSRSKRSSWKVSESSDAVVEPDTSTKDPSSHKINQTGKSPRGQLKPGPEQSSLSSEVQDSDSDRKLTSPTQLKTKRKKTRDPQQLVVSSPVRDDSDAAVKNGGSKFSSLKPPESTERKMRKSGSESGAESPGISIPSSKEVVISSTELKKPTAMDWEPSEVPPDTKNDGNASIEIIDLSDTREESSSKTPESSKKSRKKKASGFELSSISSECQVSCSNESIIPTKEVNGVKLLEENGTGTDLQSKSDTPKDISNGNKSPKVPGKKKKSKKRRKSGSEKLLLDGSINKNDLISSYKDDGGKGTSKKHKKRKQRDLQKIKGPEPMDDARTKESATKMGDSEVTVRRRGGGTIIESRPVFSDDAKYIYVNCGWGVRVFSIETGECVRVFDAYSKDHKVVTCFCWKSCPAALTSDGVFIVWHPRSGKVQRKVRLNVQVLVVDGFFFSVGPEVILCLVLETKEATMLRVYSGTTFRSQQHPLNSRMIGHPYNLHHLSVGGNPERPFIAYISHNKTLNIVNVRNKSFVKSVAAGAGKHWTCVQCHPMEDTVALGDSLGRIVVFKIVKDRHSQLVSSVYHWHTLPVSEIAFTPAGSSLYSGGGELTLVKWNLENPHIRNYLPRLSADIVHITISPYNQMIAVATLDNGIQIVTPNNKLHCVLQQLSWSVFAGEQEGMFPAGLVYDPRSRGLILNGRPGHLQLYSPLSETLTYNIDVTMMNYLTQERNKVIVNTHVSHSAITSDGLWLATVETRYEPGLALELKLKFWEYVVDKKRFVLTTVIDMPHDGKVHSIKFSPGPTGPASNEDVGSDPEVILASTGADKKLRLWSKTAIDSIYRKGSTWRCQNACFYRDRPCGPCSFSYDGSLLAVGFGSVVTLWDVDNVVLKQTIARTTEELKFVEFGQDDCCHILMCATESNIVAWNLLTLSLVWKVETRAVLFVPDPRSCFVAIFTFENQWKILDAHDGKVAYMMNNEGKSEVSNQSTKPQVLSAVFVPRHRPNPDAPQWMKNSYLYYIDIYQELNCLEPANEISQLPTFQLALDKDAATPFGSLVGAKSVRETTDEELTKQAVGYGVLGSQAVTQLLRPPAHTLPPVSLLCGSFLQSFIIMKRDAPHAGSDDENKSEDDKTTVVASSDSEDETKKSSKSEKSPKPGKSGKQRQRRRRSQKNKKKTGSSEKDGLDEQMEIETVDLRQHFKPLDEDDTEAMFVIDD